ncbi:MAG: radical SAM protein [Candidatus Verstraetearchaeota archaeon]|nr:radical SAM protein [Candidatus Verstraetearchaeota archaeon]
MEEGGNLMAELFEIPDGTPLMGAVTFGLIDRGTNVIQVRPSTSCPLNCIFCSTDAGPYSQRRRAEYVVRLDHMMEWFRELVKVKGSGVEAHIDTVGDPFTYPQLVELVQEIKKLEEVRIVSMQTHGHLMNERILGELAEAGLSRINLSVDALDPWLAKRLAGTEGYDVERVVANARYALENTSVDVLLAPVWVHPLNDSELEGLIALAKDMDAGRRSPPLGIQKCEYHRFGRRTKEMRHVSWYTFYGKMRELEKKTGMKLVIRASDFGIRPARTVEAPFRVGERLMVRIVGPGWLNGESLATTRDLRWAVTVVGEELPAGEEVRVRLLRTKDSILVGRPS